jgi:septum formation protein
LTEVGYDFMVIPSDIEEIVDESLSIPKAIEKLSCDKAEAVASRKDIPVDAVVVAADSVVVFDGEIIGKPKDKADLIRTLKRLSNKTHQFITGFTVVDVQSRKITSGVVTAKVRLKQLSTEEIEEHTRDKIAYTKAGGYGIKEHSKQLVKSYQGDHDNIRGLPIKAVSKILAEHNIKPNRK